MSKPFSLLVAGLCALVPIAASAQIGPFTTPGATSVSPLPKEDRQREARDRARRAVASESASAAPVPAEPPATKLTACLSAIDGNADGAADAARHWLAEAKGAERVEAGQCLGSAQVAQEDFAEARASFIAARDAAPATDRGTRARLGAMAGNAALAGVDPAGALAAFDAARGDAGGVGDKTLASGIATDRARALVALKRDDEAAAALAEARTIDPGDAEAWLLSATLSRRMNRLGEAQAQIEQAARLLPIDPQIGLEAGVIAMLAGRPDAARKSWQSVLAAAPQSPSATTAQGYLAQLGSVPAATIPKEARR